MKYDFLLLVRGKLQERTRLVRLKLSAGEMLEIEGRLTAALEAGLLAEGELIAFDSPTYKSWKKGSVAREIIETLSDPGHHGKEEFFKRRDADLLQLPKVRKGEPHLLEDVSTMRSGSEGGRGDRALEEGIAIMGEYVTLSSEQSTDQDRATRGARETELHSEGHGLILPNVSPRLRDETPERAGSSRSDREGSNAVQALNPASSSSAPREELGSDGNLPRKELSRTEGSSRYDLERRRLQSDRG